MQQRFVNAFVYGLIGGTSSWSAPKIARYLISRSEFEWLRDWGLPTAAALVAAILAAVLCSIWVLVFYSMKRVDSQAGSTNRQG